MLLQNFALFLCSRQEQSEVLQKCLPLSYQAYKERDLPLRGEGTLARCGQGQREGEGEKWTQVPRFLKKLYLSGLYCRCSGSGEAYAKQS